MIREWLAPRKPYVVPAAVVSVGALVLGGAGWSAFGAAACLIAAAALMGSGAWQALPAAFLAAAGAALGHGSQAAGLLLASGLLSAVSGRSLPDRSLGLLGALLSSQACDLVGTLPVLAGALPAVFFDRPLPRAILAGALMPASMLIWSFPVASAPSEVVVQEVFTRQGESWPEVVHLDQSSPSALMRVEEAAGRVELVLEAGGVRDSLPLGYVAVEGGMIPVLPGSDSLTLDAPGPFLEIRLVRPPLPFQHPVIHVGPSRGTP